ncbi:MAG: peptidoglycan bridge formation glycyltransferase FemA/FemB family protein [Ktedonobacteraceae bacterium]|nr:peptidoglycan bridge formation glycyltransferase FemA/FemB family protein [Ktedonobacteraceae bacterium]
MEAQMITDRQLWNDFVQSSACCNITQSYEWGDLAGYVGKKEALRIGVVDSSGKLCAAMLVLVADAPIIKQRYFYAPRGPVIDDPDSPALGVLLDYTRFWARKQNAFMLKVEPGVEDHNLPWLAALRHHGFRINPHHAHIRHEWVLNIIPSEASLLSQMKPKWRYNIRLAERKGVTIRRGIGTDDLDTFYELYTTTSQRDRFVINKKAYYADFLHLYGKTDQAILLLAEHEGIPIAGAVMAHVGPWCYYMYGASSNEQRERMPNHLIQWTGIQWAKSKGCYYYNFRGIPEVLEEGRELWGVYTFKRGFGGFPIHSLATHDLVYQPLIYEVYKNLLHIKRQRDEHQRQKIEANLALARRRG